MRSVGVRELKARTSEVLRQLQEEGETVQVTRRGRAVALLVPIYGGTSTAVDDSAVWADMDRLAEELSAHWPAGVTAEDAVKEQRREL